MDAILASRIKRTTRRMPVKIHIRPHLPRLTLLQRFAAVGLLVFIVLGFGLAVFLGRSIESSALASARQTAYDTLHEQLLRNLRPADLASPMTGARYADFNKFISQNIKSTRTVRIKVWNPSGTVVYSDARSLVGRRFPADTGLDQALHGQVSAEVSNLSDAENQSERGITGGRLMQVYIPIQFDRNGPVLGSFEIYQTYEPVAGDIANLQHTVYGMLGGGLFVLYVLLFGVVRSGSKTIERQQRQLGGYTAELESSYRETIASLGAAVDARDSSLEQHSQRVTGLTLDLGRWLSLSEAEVRDLEHGALLHDIGKIGISDLILLKADVLNEYEWTQMRRHPEIGYYMLREVGFLKDALPIILHHHERWDGSGYPHGLEGDAIPVAARLFAVVDAYDAMTSSRPYRAAGTHEEAMAELWKGAGAHFDPAMVSAFYQMMENRRASGEDPEPSLRSDHPGAFSHFAAGQ
jgi:putative nucleotidyltransferase with HDIG domain